MLAPTGLSAQKRVIKVQGHPHELLTQKHGGKEDATKEPRLTGTPTDSIKISDITCWAGSVDPTITPNYVDSAILVIKWTKRPIMEDTPDTIFVWGYRWNTISIYIDPVYGPDTSEVKKYTIDMIRAVANADCRFLALLQNTSEGNFTAGGFGYNAFPGNSGRAPVGFNASAAATDTRIKFHYTGSPNCAVGQGAVPYSVSDQVSEAQKRAGIAAESATGTGIIRHPFDADYGYPAYDYDYWQLPNLPIEVPLYWQAGWYNGYWAFYNKDQLIGPFSVSNYSITTRQLGHYTVDGFVFEDNPLVWPPLHDMGGGYSAPYYPCNCGCAN
jgi:hypothetical protein